MKKNIYMTIAHKEGYTTGSNFGLKIKKLGGCRIFSTFEEADKATKFIAQGQSDWIAGEYINNR